MKKISFILILSILLFCFSNKSFSQQDQRVEVAYMFAFGRPPSAAELNYWLGRRLLSITQLLGLHREGFIEYPSLHKETIINSYIDALGRNPSEDEIKYWMNGNDIYIQLMSSHVEFLKSNRWENEKVIKLSYNTALQRDPTYTEIKFWRKKGTPFFILLGYHNYCKKNNKTKTRNKDKIDLINLVSVSAVSLSPAIATESLKIMNQNIKPLINNFMSQRGGSVIISGKGNNFKQNQSM